MPKKRPGLIFDVDGVLTKPIIKTPLISIIDPDLMSIIENLADLGYKIIFITGRGDRWIKEKIFQYFSQNIGLTTIPMYMEYGLTFWKDNRLIITQDGFNFRKEIYPKILHYLNLETEKLGYYFETNVIYWDYPDHGGLWIEDKKAMLSLATNSDISANEVHSLFDNMNSDLKTQVRVIKHHLGMDFIPAGWSKENAVELALNIAEKTNTHWYVFGDNPSDREMTRPLQHWTFIDTKEGASNATKQFLLNKLF